MSDNALLTAESAKKNQNSDLIDLSLGYGVLIETMRETFLQNKMPLAMVIRGPKGVGKKTLCRLFAAEVLGIYPWLSYFSGDASFSLCAKHAADQHPETNTETMGMLLADSGSPQFALSGESSSAKFGSAGSVSKKANLVALHERWAKDLDRLLAHAEYIEVQPGAGIDEIRALRQKLSYTRQGSVWRIVMLPEAQMLSISSRNALLKWIESPPPKTVFVLTASSDLPKTLASRCRAYVMAPLGREEFFRIRTTARYAVEAQNNSEKTSEHPPTPADRAWLFKLSQGCLELDAFWTENFSWAQHGWALLHRSSLGDCLVPEDWMKETALVAPYFWEMMYVWGCDMHHWAYQHDFFIHWDGFWQATWALIQDHRVYHTDLTALIHTVLARIHGFFSHYKVPVMPIDWGSEHLYT